MQSEVNESGPSSLAFPDLLQPLGELHVLAVVDGAIDDDHRVVGEGLLHRRHQVLGAPDPVALGAEALGVLHAVGILEVDEGRAPEVAQLVPGDEAVLRIVPDEDHDRRLHAHRRLDLLRVHHEARISRDRDHLLVGIRELGRNGARHRDAHRREAVGDDAGVGPLGAVHARHPHLVRAHVADGDILGPEYLAHVPHDLLRLHREVRVLRILGAVVEDRFAHVLERRLLARRSLQRDAAQRMPDVAEHAHRDDVVRVDLGRQRVDVDDGLVVVRIAHVGVVLDHVVADADHDVRLLEGEPRQVARLQADGSEAQLVGERHDALGHEGVGHRDLQQLREAHQRIGRALADHGVAREDDRILRRRDQFRGVIDLGLGRDGRIGRLHRDRLLVDLHLGDVLREIDEGSARLLGLRDLEGLAHDLGRDLGLEDLCAVLGDRVEHVHQVEDLVAFLVQSRRRALPRDRDDRRAVHVGVGHAGDEVGRTRPQRRHAHARLLGETSVDVGHERRALLVMAGDEVDGAREQGGHDVDVLLAGNAEDVLDALVLEALDHQLRRGSLGLRLGGLVVRHGALRSGGPRISNQFTLLLTQSGKTGMADESRKVLYAALAGNVLVTLCKFGAAALTHSSAMLSEAVHSLVDTGNGLLLIYGAYRSAKPPDARRPLGYGRDLYFWSFLVSLLIFGFGAGFAIYEGIRHILNPVTIESPLVNYGVLALAALFEGGSWVVAFREFRRRKGDRGYLQAAEETKDPRTLMVFLEDSAALAGITLAFAGMLAAQLLGEPRYDGAASIAIGLLLAVVAEIVRLGKENDLP